MAAFNRLGCEAGRRAAGLLLITMTVIVLSQVVFRYLLNDSLIWSEEISKTLMVWAALLVAPWAYRYGANVRIEMFVDALPARLRLALHLALNLLVVWILTVFLVESFGMVGRGFSISAASLPVPVGWFYLILPISLTVMVSVGIELLMRDLLTLRYPQRDFRVPGAEAVNVVEGE